MANRCQTYGMLDNTPREQFPIIARPNLSAQKDEAGDFDGVAEYGEGRGEVRRSYLLDGGGHVWRR